MDRHDIPEHITAKDIAQMHQEDLKIEAQFNCRGLTYWCDEERRTAFCLVEAPNMQSIHDMHNYAHGSVPHTIIEVDDVIVESFLGRIADPIKAKNVELNIINEPAFRVIMASRIQRLSLKNSTSKKLSKDIQNAIKSTINCVKEFDGRIVKQKADYFLTVFNSVTNAASCAIALEKAFSTTYNADIKLNIGLSAGIPVTDKSDFFEDTIKTAERLCNVTKESLVISNEIKDLYESENLNTLINKTVHTLNANDEYFLNTLMDYTEKEWQNTTLKVDSYCKKLGYSKSQLNRKIKSLTGKSPNIFIKDYRLNEALKLINKQTDSISEIAFKTGFNTPAYFSKRFFEKYGVLPSSYIKTMAI